MHYLSLKAPTPSSWVSRIELATNNPVPVINLTYNGSYVRTGLGLSVGYARLVLPEKHMA